MTQIINNNYTVINVNNTVINNYVAPAWLPPRPPSNGWGIGVSSGGFAFNYWDGRNGYNQDFAINIFGTFGHQRYGGWDGMMVSGGYYAYGYGYIQGCIDYGDCRVWVPGFWASYTVDECGPTQVWVPPVYEWVWTGCCWEQVQVDGGYFDTVYGGCRPIPRSYWVPGHFEYYRC